MRPGFRLTAIRHAGAVLLAALAASVALPACAKPFTIIITELETPLTQNSVIDLAKVLGYYDREGVEVNLVRVNATPSAVAALRAGQGDMANIGFDIALQLVARGQMDLRGVISPDKALPFVIVAKKDITSPKQLEQRVVGIGRIGSVDYVQTRNVLNSLGVKVDTIRYLALGQPGVRAQALVAGQIDATAITVGSWITMPKRDGLAVLVDQEKYYAAAPFITKLSVTTAATAKDRHADIEKVVRATVKASRDFAKNPELWIEAMAKARPDVPREQLEVLAKAYQTSWSVNGGLEERDLQFTIDGLYQNEEFKQIPRRVKPSDWIDKSFLEAVFKDEGEFQTPAAK